MSDARLIIAPPEFDPIRWIAEAEALGCHPYLVRNPSGVPSLCLNVENMRGDLAEVSRAINPPDERERRRRVQEVLGELAWREAEAQSRATQPLASKAATRS